MRFNTINKLIKLIKFFIKLGLRFLLLYPFYFLSKIFPRDKKIWIFGNHTNSFNDNSKYFFLYVSDNHRDIIRPIWISNSKKVVENLNKLGYEAYYKWSIKGLFFSLRGYMYIYTGWSSDINYWTSGGALRLNLWHGIPLKRIGFDIKVGIGAKFYHSKRRYINKLLCPSMFQKHHYVLSTSPLVSKLFSSAFRISLDRIIEAGYPRCDHFLWDKMSLINFLKQKEPKMLEFIKSLAKYNKVIIYAPTFREMGTNIISDVIDLQKLNEYLSSKNWIFLIKQHPFIPQNTIIDFSNIKLLDNKMDIYLILPFTDLLITDYSSIMFDYLLLNKPVLLYQYDRIDYLNNERGFYSETLKLVEQYLPIFMNFADLLKSIDNYFKLPINFTEIQKILWANQFNSSEYLYNFIISKLKLK